MLRFQFGKCSACRPLIASNYRRCSSTFLHPNNKTSILQPPETEDVLMATVDPLDQIRRSFHPAIVRAYKESKILKKPKPDFTRLVKSTENGVKHLNRTLQQRQEWSIARARRIRVISEGQAFLTEQLPKLLQGIKSAEELKGVISLLAIYFPSSQAVWETLDRHIAEHCVAIDGVKTNGASLTQVETALLASYVLHSAARAYKFDLQLFQTPKAILTYYIQLASKLRSNPQSFHSRVMNNSINPFRHLFPVTVLEAGLNAIGITPQVTDSKAIELLSLQLHLFAELIPSQRTNHNPRDYIFPATSYPTDPIIKLDHPISPFYPLAVDLSDHALHVLSLTSNPVKLSSLRQVWEPLRYLDCENRFTLYRRLHQEIYHSLVTDPLQILHEEEMVCSLYDFMFTTNFKSQQILQKVSEIYSSYGMNYKDYGVRFFHALLELEAIQYAPSILGRLLHQLDYTISMQRLTQVSRGNSFRLSTVAAQELHEYLQASPALIAMKDPLEVTPSSSSSSILTDRFLNDLVLGILCFHQLPATAPSKQLLEQYEQILATSSYLETSMPIDVAINLLRLYAHLARKPLPLYQKLFQRIASPSPGIQSLNLPQLLGLLETASRLNDLPLSPTQMQEMIHITYQKVKNSQHKGIFRLQFLWSMALLQQLTLTQYTELEAAVMEVYQQSKWSDGRASQFQMLCQVYNELEIISSQQNLPAEPLISSSSSSDTKESSTLSSSSNPQKPSLPKDYIFRDEDEMERYLQDYVSSQDRHLVRHHSHQQKNRQLPPSLQRLQSLLAKEVHRRPSFASHTTISQLHKTTSQLLSDHQIIHTNEKQLSNYYFVDILIPYRERYPWSAAIKKPLILEIDGPSHFESFAQERVGSSMMKQRHIEAKGYHVVSIPYTLLTAEGKSDEETYQEMVQCIIRSATNRASSS